MLSKTLAAFAVCALVSFPARGQEAASTPASQPGGMMGGRGDMGQMMAQCQAKCQAHMEAADQLMQTLEEAKASNDPAKMRAAIEKTQEVMRQGKQNMSECAAMMQKMHGGMGMGKGMGMMGGQTTGTMGMTGQPGAPQ